ncbi:alpha-amylase family protein [Dactylosporangium matsuzakiense]|uniref:Trehalose synthase n=1 Tax=Dactylosporangium matsuzakiense TaxID=53360 RepID=A0A9W6KW81_9ACTN|nr:alpha-amylase family protein [Dactylosporangium matsuzakiense]UWZ43835.1 alpha-amylase family protein [Dactylosporangium matsuzakiense]GLL07849.1 trehalose synthase [Dactylosporangium matsuzakiense]
MGERWYTESVIYCLDVETFQDSNDDGIGDFQGLISRLDYLTRLGVNCLWLSPIHPTPGKDDGYDVTDFYNVDPRLGTLGDFAELLHQAANRGIKVMIDLVVNHTSDEHPWFQSAVSSPDSPYRDWYVWADKEPADRHQGMVFPGEQSETWTYHRRARAWYYHRFYNFQPDLNFANPAVRAEIKKVLAFWIQLGVAGFRMDAVPFIIELTEPGNANSPMDFDYLSELRSHVQWRRGDAVLLAEANVEPEKLPEYFGDAGGTGNRIHMLFDFMLNGRLVLALARQNPEPVIEWLRTTPKLPPGGHWATFLRNHDEIDLSRLTAEQRSDVFAEFGPDENMQLYGRGIRRRLAPMLGGDRDRIELAYSLQFTMRGTPVLRYGEEIGMGEDLSLEGRYAIRTPMQWSFDTHGGFSSVDPIRPVIEKGDYGYETVNVTAQRHDDRSLLAWFERMIRTLRESPEVSNGTCSVIDQALPPGVLAHRADGPTGSMLFLHNLGTDDVVVDLGSLHAETNHPNEVFGDQDYPEVGDLSELALGPYGYRWIRLKRASV